VGLQCGALRRASRTGGSPIIPPAAIRRQACVWGRKAVGMFYRLGLAMARLRYWVLGLWLIAALASVPFAPRVAEALSPGGFSSPDMESQQAIDALQSGLHTSFTNVLVIFSSKTLTA